MKCPNDCDNEECPYNAREVLIAETVADCMKMFAERGLSTFEGVTTLFLATRLTIQRVIKLGLPDRAAYLGAARELGDDIYEDIADAEAADEATDEEEVEPGPNETNPRLN